MDADAQRWRSVAVILARMAQVRRDLGSEGVWRVADGAGQGLLAGVAGLHAALCYTDAFTGSLAVYFVPVALGIQRVFFILTALAFLGSIDDGNPSLSAGMATAVRVCAFGLGVDCHRPMCSLAVQCICLRSCSMCLLRRWI
jgi:hypothetical protein